MNPWNLPDDYFYNHLIYPYKGGKIPFDQYMRERELAPADVYPIGPPFREEPMTKEEIEKQIVELKGKLEEIEDKRRNRPNDVEVACKSICGGKTTVMITCDYKYIYIQRDGVPWHDASEAKSIIQALQKCVDWLESK